ncbi:cob(I)yrinic acid a,c-diamide adenosyltransferase [Botrimarina sp.]|uniref:cob(I)yrinic acid a,c-diamide adenosyltransferase n=1 Tax=Botrimarina sp. TaxID=2795802 RepID=UPI0032EC1E65
MKIYTKTGDEGETSLLGGQRVRKNHTRIAAYGALDELNAVLGVARAELARQADLPGEFIDSIDRLIDEVQNHLFDLGAELASPSPAESGLLLLQAADVERLEAAIDQHQAGLPPLKQFILPGGVAAAAFLHQARCVCRRAERHVVTLAASEPVRELPVRYVNRLSDLLFVLARAANQAAGVADVPWRKPSG